tara:strand:+ start:3886 stop:4158 length:273 start_codon:yes stop_codon:yes gene_type:complete
MAIDTKEYLKYIKSQHCLICGGTPVDPDHLEAIGMGNNRNKQTPKDFSCIPLCREHHQDRHGMGIKRFNEHYRIDVWKEAFKLLRRYFIS